MEAQQPSDFAVDLARLSGGVSPEGADPARLERRDRVEVYFRAEVLPGTVCAVVAALTPREEPRRWWLPAWRPALAAGALAAVIFAVVLVGSRLPPAGDEVPGVRAKGAVGLEVFGHRASDTFRVQEGALLRPGDQLKFRVVAPGDGWAAVFSVEDSGRVTLFHPLGAAGPLRVGADPFVPPDSIVLDGSVGPERVVVVFRHEPFDVASLARELQASAQRAGGVGSPLALPAGYEQASLLFVKAAVRP